MPERRSRLTPERRRGGSEPLPGVRPKTVSVRRMVTWLPRSWLARYITWSAWRTRMSVDDREEAVLDAPRRARLFVSVGGVASRRRSLGEISLPYPPFSIGRHLRKQNPRLISQRTDAIVARSVEYRLDLPCTPSLAHGCCAPGVSHCPCSRCVQSPRRCGARIGRADCRIMCIPKLTLFPHLARRAGHGERKVHVLL